MREVKKTIEKRFTRYDLFLSETEGYNRGFSAGRSVGYEEGVFDQISCALKEEAGRSIVSHRINKMRRTNITLKVLTYLVWASILFVVFYKYLEHMGGIIKV